MAYKKLPLASVEGLCRQVFIKLGFHPEESRQIADVLLTADLYGIESHGVQRMIRYYTEMRRGDVDVGAQLEVVHETPISATIDAHRGMGQLVSRRAMELAIKKALTTGIGMVAVRRSNHYGIAGYYSKMASDADLMGVCMTNTEAIMVPTHGKQAMLGTNPIAVSMPADPTPFLFDAATTVVPRGKLEVYNKKEEPLPADWALDQNGQVSYDPGLVLHNIIGKLGGGILPLGGAGELSSGYKGYGFGLICELFTSMMAGGFSSNHCVTKDRNQVSHCFWAIDYGIFGDKAAIRQNFSTFLEELRQSEKADGQDRIYIHGEKELESRAEKEREGIPLNEKTFAELQMIAAELGLDSAPYIGAEF